MESTEHTQNEDKTRYVEDLEDHQDYWLSITDASRVCRVQDVSIRRAIAAGRLPVRRMPAGENKRTRFVRASDLPRANFPILDSSAAITSDIRKVDILSLPLQQQKLAEQQEAQAADFALLRAEIQEANRLQAERYQQDQQATQEHMKQMQADIMTALCRQQEAQSDDLAQLRFEMQEAQRLQAEQYQQDQLAAQEHVNQMQADFADFREALRQQQQDMQQRLAAFDQRMADMADLVRAQARHSQEALQELERKVDERLTHISAERQADLEKIKQQFASHSSEQATVLHQLETSLAEMHADQQLQIGTLEKDQARDIADLNSQLTDLATGNESQTTAITEIQQRAGTQEQRLTDLFRLLQNEIAARQALSDEIAHQKKTVKPSQTKGQP